MEAAEAGSPVPELYRMGGVRPRSTRGPANNPADRESTKLGLWPLLSVSAQGQRIWLESQARLPDISRAGVEFAHQSQKAGLTREKPEPLSVPTSINDVWSMDFMHDQLPDGRSIRLFLT